MEALQAHAAPLAEGPDAAVLEAWGRATGDADAAARRHGADDAAERSDDGNDRVRWTPPLGSVSRLVQMSLAVCLKLQVLELEQEMSSATLQS